MIEDLDPAAVEGRDAEESAARRILSSRKSRLWEHYKERYAARAKADDNGMVDVFLVRFAEAYEKAVR